MRTVTPPASPLDPGDTPQTPDTTSFASRCHNAISRRELSLVTVKVRSLLAERHHADYQLDVIRHILEKIRGSQQERAGAGLAVDCRAERQRLGLEHEKYAGRLLTANKDYARYRKEFARYGFDFDELEDEAAREAEARLRLEAGRKGIEERQDGRRRQRRSSACSEHFFTPRQSYTASESESRGEVDGQGEGSDLPSPTPRVGMQQGSGDATMRYLIVALAGLKIGSALLAQ